MSESIEASLDHIARIGVRIQQLQGIQTQAVDQVTHRISVEIGGGDLDGPTILSYYERLREACSNTPGWYKKWRFAGLGSPGRLKADAGLYQCWQPNFPDGSWGQTSPYPGDAYPAHGVSVVYVLYSASGDPVYVGSSSNFRLRLTEHRREKEFAAWRAWPCRDREDAYRREEQMLRDVLPPLNRKAGR